MLSAGQFRLLSLRTGLSSLFPHGDRSVDEARETYERLVEIFPTCGRYWKLYIEQEVTVISDISFIVGINKLTLGLAFMKSEYTIDLLSYHMFYFLYRLELESLKTLKR